LRRFAPPVGVQQVRLCDRSSLRRFAPPVGVPHFYPCDRSSLRRFAPLVGVPHSSRDRAAMNQSQRTLQEFRTTLSPAEVLAEAKQFFTQRISLYATFIDRDGPTFVTFRGQGGEEIVIAADVHDGATRVT